MIRVVEMVYGRVLMADTESGFQAMAGSGIYYEHTDLMQVANLLRDRERGIIIDAGANYGVWSVALAPFAEQVIAIEPQRSVYNMLCGTVALNDLSYIVFPHRLAVGRVPRMDEIAIIDYGTAGAFGGLSLGDEPTPPGCVAPFKIIGREPVQVVRLDGCLDTKQRVSFIKMDIEGGEADALAGAVTTIRKWRPLMFIESAHARTDKDALRHQIEGFDYEVRDLKINFLCVPR